MYCMYIHNDIPVSFHFRTLVHPALRPGSDVLEPRPRSGVEALMDRNRTRSLDAGKQKAAKKKKRQSVSDK